MAIIKEILCLHHSHLDVGYTHPQNMLLELQCDYIDQALDLCVKTAEYPEESRFRWTCEATYPVLRWFETAEKERIELFRRLVKEGYISVAALPMHTTPGCTAQQMTQALQQLDEVRRITGSGITTAINHDVNGQPWTLSSLLLDSNVEFYITGINIHFGGIPFPRPYAFQWETPDRRKLTSFVGEHYSLFSQFFYTCEGSTQKMHQGVQEYVKRVEEGGWRQDFIYLTATNPPLFDNNCPDAYLADLIRRYNEEDHEQKIRFVTPEMLYERVKKIGINNLPVHGGDWTDYWNFGCASTAREVKVNRRAKNLLFKNDFLECVWQPSLARMQKITGEAYQNTILFDEHTWGASESVTKPDQEETYVQLNHKKEYAYNAADLSAYLVSCQMERLAENPSQADEQQGIVAVNPTAFPMQHELRFPSYMNQSGRTLSALRAKEYLPYEKNDNDYEDYGTVEIPPFTAQKIPFANLKSVKGKTAKGCSLKDSVLDTPFYEVSLHPVTSRIRQIVEKRSGRELIDTDSEWGFFDPVEERVDERYGKASRSTIFPRDVDKGNRSITQWQHDWRAVRESIDKSAGFYTEETKETVTLCYSSETRNMKKLVQRITFSTVHPRILLDVTFRKEPETEPLGIYFAFPLRLHQNWNCVYDTAETFVKLDKEQLGNVCRDYITVDKSVSLFDAAGGVTLSCPDAPMVQVGNFQFGRENKQINRKENPLLLAWPLNNYWDTNFAASQEGKMSFHYELSAFREFNERDACRIGLQALAPCAAGAAIQCDKEFSQEFLHYESETSAPIFIRPQYKRDGWLAAVKNFTDHEGKCILSVPGRPIKSAAVTDIQGNSRKELSITDNQILLVQKEKALTFLTLTF